MIALSLQCPHLFLPSLGELRTLALLDREEQAVYNLLVKATDGGGRSCQAAIVLTLEDVNDNAPEFTAEPYTITVFENTEPGTPLTRVQATDADTGILRDGDALSVGCAEGFEFPVMEHAPLTSFPHAHGGTWPCCSHDKLKPFFISV
jgi:protocadherin Fat 1/2/3